MAYQSNTPAVNRNWFEYQAPSPSEIERIAKIRQGFLELYDILDFNAPSSRELSTAYQHLRTAMMWANAAVVFEATQNAREGAPTSFTGLTFSGASGGNE